MFIVKCILFILAVVLFRLAHNAKDKGNSKCCRILLVLALVCSLAWCILIALSWTIFSLGITMFFATACVYAAFKKRKERFVTIWIMISVTSVILVTNSVNYAFNIKYADEPEIKTTKFDIISIERSFSPSGSISGNGSFVYGHIDGKISKQDYYDLYYALDDGGEMFLSIDAKGIPIYPLKDGEMPHLLKIEEYLYFEDHNVRPVIKFWPKVTVQYKLYLPKSLMEALYKLNKF